ncbi:hypothetical protein NHP21005_02750 [Helicobacter sp. NHP21005]|nr:hypothetical protein [Helicobacter sp. NHP21005]BEG56587.1 hypothetical protein NHP21005_02750 [Helicobacter sp. NHP21005]
MNENKNTPKSIQDALKNTHNPKQTLSVLKTKPNQVENLCPLI